MRVLLVGISSFCILASAIIIMAGPLDGKISNSIAIAVLILTFFLAIFISSIIFNERNPRITLPTMEELENQGLVISQEYKATRAFQVDEFEDEGSSYYIELEDGKVLFLSGQYLYEYEPIDDDADEKRTFPCTEFLVKRHKTKGYVLEINTGGVPIKPEVVAPYFSEDDFDSNVIPADGTIIQDKSFDEIKRERLKNRSL